MFNDPQVSNQVYLNFADKSTAMICTLLPIELCIVWLNLTLTLRPPSTTLIPYANTLDTDETPSNSASHPNPSCLTHRQHFQF